MMRHQIARARKFYDYAETGIPFLRPGMPQKTTLAMGRIYGEILKAIEYDQFNTFDQRVFVGTRRKLSLLFQAWQPTRQS